MKVRQIFWLEKRFYSGWELKKDASDSQMSSSVCPYGPIIFSCQMVGPCVCSLLIKKHQTEHHNQDEKTHRALLLKDFVMGDSVGR